MHGTALLAALMVLAPAPERPPVQRPSGLRPRKDPSPKPEPKPAPRPDPSPPPAPEVPTQAVPDSPLEPAPEPPLTPPAADPPTEFVAPLAPPPAPEGPEPVSVSGELPPDPIEAPRWTGIGPLVSAGVLGAAAFAQQAGAWSRAKANCDRPIETKGAGTSLAFVDCLAEESRALTLRITSAVSLGAAIGLGTLGAVIIGRRHAHSDAGSGHTRKTKAMIGAGASFAAIGLVSWITTRWLVQRNRIGCDTEACAVKADMLTLDASALVSAIGGGLLGYSLGYRNRRRALAEQVALVPTVGADSVGIRVGGRF